MLRSLASRVVASPSLSLTLSRSSLLTSSRFAASSVKSFPTIRCISTSTINRAQPSNTLSQAAAATVTPTATPAATPAASSSPASSSPASEPQTMNQLVSEYGGWAPIIGFGTILALSKELLILNEELLLVTNMATVLTILWLGLSDHVKAAMKEEALAKKKRADEFCELHAEIARQGIHKLKTNLAAPEVYKALKSEYSAAVAAAIKAKDMKARVAARDAVVAKLQALKTKEDSEMASYLDEVYEKTSNYVRNAAANLSAADRQLLIEHAISVVGGSTAPLDPAKDPLKKLYVTYFEGRQYEKEIEADRQAKKNKK